LNSQSNFSAIPAVSIADEMICSLSVCERLLRGPNSGWMLGDMGMPYLATSMFQHERYEQSSNRDGGHSKEIRQDHLADMVLQEGPPGLVRRAAERA
jgi:hypothetical protein